jgi:hypothetical protein
MLNEEMMSPAIGNLSKALSLAQAEIKGAKKDNNNPFFRSKYADLASVQEACKEALSKNEICYIQVTDTDMNLITILSHSSGEWIKGIIPIKAIPDKSGVIMPQAMGSAITYARRYALAAIAGVAPEDDDGESAMNRKDAMTGAPKKMLQKDLKAMAEEVLAAMEFVTTQAEFEAFRNAQGHKVRLMQNEGYAGVDELVSRINEFKDGLPKSQGENHDN